MIKYIYIYVKMQQNMQLSIHDSKHTCHTNAWRGGVKGIISCFKTQCLGNTTYTVGCCCHSHLHLNFERNSLEKLD